jgi:hypothetical protein
MRHRTSHLPVTPLMPSAKAVVFPPSASRARGLVHRRWTYAWGPITQVIEGPESKDFIAESIFLAWVDRRLYAVHWRQPADPNGEWAENACCPEPGDRGLGELWMWLTDLRLLNGDQVRSALGAAAGLLYAMAPTHEHFVGLLRHPDERVQVETQLHLPSPSSSALPRGASKAKRRR